MHNLVLTREVIINAMFPVDRMRELIFAIGQYVVIAELMGHHAPSSSSVLSGILFNRVD